MWRKQSPEPGRLRHKNPTKKLKGTCRQACLTLVLNWKLLFYLQLRILSAKMQMSPDDLAQLRSC